LFVRVVTVLAGTGTHFTVNLPSPTTVEMAATTTSAITVDEFEPRSAATRFRLSPTTEVGRW